MAQPWEQLADLVACVYDRCALLEQPPETRLDGLSTLQKREQQWHNQALEIMDGGGVCGFTYLSHMLNLTTFETHCFRMTLAVELDSNLEGVYAKAQDGVCRLPTVTLCLDTFATAPQSRTKALTNWRSHRETLKLLFDQGLTVDSPQSALTVGLKLSPRIVDFILDPGTPNTALVGKINLDLTPTTMVIHQDLVENLHLFQQENPSLYHIHGDKGVGKQTLVRHSLSTQKKAPLVVEIPALLGIDEWNRAILQVCREVVLTGGVPVLSGCDVLAPMENQPPDGRLSAMLQQLSKCSDTVFFLSQCKWEQSWDATPFARVSLEIPIPDTQERMALFAHGFRNLPLAEDVQFEAVATKFTLTPAQIDGAVQEAKRHQGALTSQDIHGFCRNQLAHGMGKMATSIPAVYRWEDLILPPKQKKKLEYACAQVEYRHRVYHSWGFGSKRAYGRGLSVLFSGPPGTGKTMAAQVMANRLHLDLYKVDIAGVMSKYIGETEKQLGAVFDEAKKSQSIL
ncbi:MAG: AAA family ATPase, partial [Eubacteriales bacterium]